VEFPQSAIRGLGLDDCFDWGGSDFSGMGDPAGALVTKKNLIPCIGSIGSLS
jgi:hypothetical protein